MSIDRTGGARTRRPSERMNELDEAEPVADHALDPAVVGVLAVEAKRQLRKRARGVRASLPRAAIVARSAALVERLLAVDRVAKAKSVALFFPMIGKNEVDLTPADAKLRSRGASVLYPAIDQETGAMTFRDPGSLEGLEERGRGFAEPAPDAPALEAIDVIVVPALMVDPRGHRLGYGAGFYDRTLPRYRPHAWAVVVAFDFQLAAELPIDEHDVPCDAVVTEARVIVVA
ncbi:MAG: 5-formyltetrahydrofolate cyclo-ligase [Polyangiaceae bacterium]